VFGRKSLDVKTADQIRKMRVAGVVVGETLELIRGEAHAGTTTGDLDRRPHFSATTASPAASA
jgi:methionyl aminopeptidase